MGDRRRGSSTQPFEQHELERLAALSAETSSTPRALQPTCKLEVDEILGLAERSVRSPTSGYQTVKLVERDERATQQMDPTHFQLMMLAERERLPLEPVDIVHMQPAEAEAWLQMRPVAGTGREPALGKRLPPAPRRPHLWAIRIVVSLFALAFVVAATLFVIAK
jgi:hypothetical protein